MTDVLDDEKTIVNFRQSNSNAESKSLGFDRPSPGGRRPSVTSSPVGLQEPSGTLPGVPVASVAQQNGASISSSSMIPSCFENQNNPLIAIAQPLLNEMVDLGKGSEQRNLEAYRSHIAEQLTKFEMLCMQYEISEEHLIYSRYVLCTAIDEMVNKSPWSGKGEWSKNSLLAQHHGETKGGEKFYDLLEHLIVHPGKHILVLELMFLIMNLGFEGKYHLQPKGYLELEKIKDNLFQTLRLQRGEPDSELSPNWRGIDDHRNPLMKIIPAWVFVAVTALILVSMYSGFSYLAEQAGDHTVIRVQQLKTAIDNTAEGNAKEAVR